MEYWKASLKAAALFGVMITVECEEVGLTTLSKAAMLQGMSNFVFIVYYNALGTLILLPIFLYNNLRICLLQICAYTGINYSSASLAAAIGNLIPVFTFILAIILSISRQWPPRPSHVGCALRQASRWRNRRFHLSTPYPSLVSVMPDSLYPNPTFHSPPTVPPYLYAQSPTRWVPPVTGSFGLGLHGSPGLWVDHPICIRFYCCSLL
ncbi:hypothetical protein Cgig2_017101 [Carnegiea gigantea]|uniref:WAT1-related protein n=1 Tax=Carnegiea gigantea TaxID=171969 RepID=A0A9Q1JK25_9CARY|nr:hypothetical protein Cgig2_017101 [Carnegiea gigantea]